ncbi:hypothetical protein PINS_up003774 [Pythium insidiosum]|nr:hypothetical protein PINS_up003774 [Pythium insidiosum]
MAPSTRQHARKAAKAAAAERYEPVETTTPTTTSRRLRVTSVEEDEEEEEDEDGEHGTDDDDATRSQSEKPRRGTARRESELVTRRQAAFGSRPRLRDDGALLQVAARSEQAKNENEDDDDDDDDDDDGDDNLVEIAIGARRLDVSEALARTSEPGNVPWMQVAVCALSAISGFLFGYDLCVMVIALPLIQTAFQLSTEMAEAVVSILMVGAVFGSLIGGVLADRLGRKRAIMLTGVFFLLGSLCMTFATSIYVMLLGRLLAGLAVGSSGPCVSTYVAEIARPEQRGALVTINEVMLCVGCLVSVAAGASLRDSQVRDRFQPWTVWCMRRLTV